MLLGSPLDSAPRSTAYRTLLKSIDLGGFDSHKFVHSADWFPIEAWKLTSKVSHRESLDPPPGSYHVVQWLRLGFGKPTEVVLAAIGRSAETIARPLGYYSRTTSFLTRSQPESSRQLHGISFGLAVNFARSTFKMRFRLFAGLLLTLAGAWVILEVAVILGHRLGIWWWIIAHLLFLFFFAGVELGFLEICLALFDGKDPTFGAAFTHLTLGPKFLVGQILYMLMVLGGLLVLVFPGVYVAVRYGFLGFCMADGEVDPMGSLKQSATITTGSTGRLFCLLFALLLFNLLGASLLGIGLFLTVPLSALTVAAVYRQLTCLKRT